jgi:hypothetical protein
MVLRWVFQSVEWMDDYWVDLMVIQLEWRWENQLVELMEN